MSLKWDSFNKEQFKRKIRELSNSCIEADRLLIITTVDGTPIPAIELEADFFSRLYSAGEIDHNTQFKVHRLPPYFSLSCLSGGKLSVKRLTSPLTAGEIGGGLNSYAKRRKLPWHLNNSPARLLW